MKAKMKAIKASRISYAKMQQMKTMEPSSHSRMIFMFWAEVFLIACGGKRTSHTVHATACRTKKGVQVFWPREDQNLYLYQRGHGRDRPLLAAGQNIDLRVHVGAEVVAVRVGHNHVGAAAAGGGLGRGFGSSGCRFASGTSSFEGLSSVHQQGSFTCSGDTQVTPSHPGADGDEAGWRQAATTRRQQQQPENNNPT